jgi:hypothetical protein
MAFAAAVMLDRSAAATNARNTAMSKLRAIGHYIR